MADGSTFFPCASRIPRGSQESLAAAILRCAAAQTGAASIAFGFQIAIEAAVVAELENKLRRSDMANIGSFKKSGQELGYAREGVL